MGGSEFKLTAIVEGPRAVPIGEPADTPDISAWECEELLGLLGPHQRYRLLPRQWGGNWPGRGNLFLVNGSMLGADWRASWGFEAESPSPIALVLRFGPDAWDDAIRRVAEGYGLSPIEAALADALAEFGEFEKASETAGLGAIAARNAVMRLRAKFGTRNLAETVEHILMPLFGPKDGILHPTDEEVAEMLEIGPRHLYVARAVASGTPRKVIARESGMSLATVKALLADVYERLDVTSAAEVSCVLAQATHVIETFLTRDNRGLAPAWHPRHARVDCSGTGRTIGYSVYGERGSPAVVIMHSSIGCRHPPTRFVRRLNRLGWQVIAPDRPGYGETSNAPSEGAQAHFEQAADDTAAILDAEGIDTVVLVARSGGNGTFVFVDRLGERVSRAILFNPTPPSHHSPVDRGPLGALKRRYARSPGSIRLLIGLFLRYATRERIVGGMRRSFAQSEPDLRALEDPRMAEDYLLACLPLRDNLSGYIVENVAWASDWDPVPTRITDRYTLVFGRHFVLHDPQVSRRYFSQILPLAQTHVVASAGQMIMYSHPDECAAVIGPPPR
jgi:pimeloyl-ACP methyl ester carboxylesterase/DNA-binding NarL/FixJ family response regulator